MLRPKLFIALLFLFSSIASEAAPNGALCEAPQSSRGKRFEIGLVYQSLLPSGLANWVAAVPTIGPVFGAPLFGGTLQLQGGTGSDPGSQLTLYVVEAAFRVELETPFFQAFGAFGAHLLHYGVAGAAPSQSPGGNFSLGLSTVLGEGFELSLGVKAYFQSRTIISFGGGFSFLI
jgi:hypothetical protein